MHILLCGRPIFHVYSLFMHRVAVWESGTHIISHQEGSTFVFPSRSIYHTYLRLKPQQQCELKHGCFFSTKYNYYLLLLLNILLHHPTRPCHNSLLLPAAPLLFACGDIKPTNQSKLPASAKPQPWCSSRRGGTTGGSGSTSRARSTPTPRHSRRKVPTTLSSWAC